MQPFYLLTHDGATLVGTRDLAVTTHKNTFALFAGTNPGDRDMIFMGPHERCYAMLRWILEEIKLRPPSGYLDARKVMDDLDRGVLPEIKD